MTAAGAAVVIMARAPFGPRPPKSRLAAPLPAEADRRRLYAAFLTDTVRASRETAAVVRIAYTPSGGTRGFDEVGVNPRELLAQRGDDLGTRERGVFTDLFAAGFSPVVMIGSDLPTLPMSRVQAALDRLTQAPDQVVLGPAEDGGYYLMGLTGTTSADVPDLFSNIRWSTTETLADTVKAANAAGLAVSYVDAWYDVDDEAGLTRLREELATAAGAARAPATKRVVEELFAEP